MEQTKTLEGKIGCKKVVMKDRLKMCSQTSSDRTCSRQGTSIINYVDGKFVFHYICQRKPY